LFIFHNKWPIRPQCSGSHKNIYATVNKFSLKQRIKLINGKTIMNLKTIKKEMWESVYKDNDPNHI
jgi:hypothetical protein